MIDKKPNLKRKLLNYFNYLYLYSKIIIINAIIIKLYSNFQFMRRKTKRNVR